MKHIFVCVVRCYSNTKCEKRILLVHHKDRDGWEFPGGKLDDDDLIDCSNFTNLKVFDILKSAHREFIEETETEMVDGKLSGIYYNANVGTLFLVYDAHSSFTEKSITTDTTIDYVKEFDINELPKLSFPTDNAVIINILKKSDDKIKIESRFADHHNMEIYECGCTHQKQTFDACGRPVNESTFLCDKHRK